jgi:hypothetical protein
MADGVSKRWTCWARILNWTCKYTMTELCKDLADRSRDIIDTEPAENGNVWKMLLGAIDSQFDAD